MLARAVLYDSASALLEVLYASRDPPSDRR
jgi:hypothetical protein